MGVVCGLLIAVALGLGFLADKLAHTLPIFTFVGLLAGIAAAGGYTYMEFKRTLRD